MGARRLQRLGAAPSLECHRRPAARRCARAARARLPLSRTLRSLRAAPRALPKSPPPALGDPAAFSPTVRCSPLISSLCPVPLAVPSPPLPCPRLASPRLASPRLASPRALMQEPAQAVRGRTERSLQRTRTRRECAPCRLTSGLSSICVARAGADRRAACDAAAAAAARQLSARARGRRGVRHAARYRRA
jgi:hypothetical protein